MTPDREPSPEFSHLLRDALLHLNSPTHLTGHPLNALLRPLLSRGADQGQGLRELLIDALEALEPHGGTSVDDAVRRPYLVLVYRCLDGFSVDEVSRRLHVGTRQCRRDLRAGLAAVATLIWGRLAQAQSVAAPAVAAADGAVSAELAALGVTLEQTPLAELCESLRPSVAAIGEMHRAAIGLQLGGDTAVLCDRMLAKQALISCLTAVAAHAAAADGPVAAIVVRTLAGLPALEVAFTPRLRPLAAAGLWAELGEALELLACQGAALQPSLAADGTCGTLTVRFDVERAQTILVVDDNEGMRQLYERYLAEGRYRVALAGSAEEAESALRARKPDAIVLDVMMRGVDGWDFLQQLKSRPAYAAVPVIVCSVLKEPGLALALGARAYLKKPIAGEALVDCLADVLARSSPGEPRRGCP
jgi:CheY-like chemotaxis protein